VTSGAELYTVAARRASAQVIGAYSTSFGRAARLLDEPVRTHVRAIYALVRVADEIVDCVDLGLTQQERAHALDTLEAETLAALEHGFSADLVVHAFAATARAHRIGAELVAPFFASMRTDLVRAVHDDASLDAYVYGSAEVVGLMCLRVFVAYAGSDPDELYAQLSEPARRLGAGFQKVNFLRDLAADSAELGRTYLPGTAPGRLTAARRDALLDDIDADLAAAEAVVPALPRSSRRAVAVALDLFADLARRLRATPVEVIERRRVRVPALTKARIVGRAALSGRLDRLRGPATAVRGAR
jgi:15-cis-phytoene synthase